MSTHSIFAASVTETVFAYYESGDEALLHHVFVELRPNLLSYAENTLGIYDHERRQDLVQQTFLSMLGSLRRHQFTGTVDTQGQRIGLLTWAKQVCRNRFLDGIESMKGKPSEPGRDENPFLRLASLSEDNHFDTLSYLPQAETVLTAATEAVLELEPRLRDVLVLIYFRGLSHQQAADQLHLRLSTLRARLDAGLGQLRTWAARQQQRPSSETYRALRHLDTGDLFQEEQVTPATLRLAS